MRKLIVVLESIRVKLGQIGNSDRWYRNSRLAYRQTLLRLTMRLEKGAPAADVHPFTFADVLCTNAGQCECICGSWRLRWPCLAPSCSFIRSRLTRARTSA